MFKKRTGIEMIFRFGSILRMQQIQYVTITSKNIRPKSKYYDLYADHKDHYDAIVDKRDKYVGISNCYFNKSINTASQYDLYVHTEK